jgi:hypothetical protein
MSGSRRNSTRPSPIPVVVLGFLATTSLALATPAKFGAAEIRSPSSLSGCTIAEPDRHPCDGTPRGTVLSGGYLGVDLGYATLTKRAGKRIGAGPGFAGQVRLAAEFWDHLLTGVGVTDLGFRDNRPVFHLEPAECTTREHPSLGYTEVECGGPDELERSHIGATLFLLEVGVQHRFRVWRSMSLTPGFAGGYAAAWSDLEKRNCGGCMPPDLDATARGIYLAPFFRATFGTLGIFGLVARSAMFVTGDTAHITSLGAELGLP